MSILEYIQIWGFPPKYGTKPTFDLSPRFCTTVPGRRPAKAWQRRSGPSQKAVKQTCLLQP